MVEIIRGILKKIGKKQTLFIEFFNKKKDKTDKLSVPDCARYFRDADYSEGCEAEAIRDDGAIKKVVIVGKAEVAPPGRAPSVSRKTPGGAGAGRREYGKRPQNSRDGGNSTADKKKAPAAVLGLPFVNPYTFVPFPGRAPIRRKPTMPAIEEIETGKNERFTGVLDLEVETVSPLLTAMPAKRSDSDGHKQEVALTIGEDVVLPATGIRGALRSMLTIITGGTLGYLDEDVVLRQARDAQLGPRLRNAGNRDLPKNAFLGLVEKAGDRFNSGRIRVDNGPVLGWIKVLDGRKEPTNPDETHESRVKNFRPRAGVSNEVWVEWKDGPIAGTISQTRKDGSSVRVKLAGRPVNSRGIKHEGVFMGNGPAIEIDRRLWRDYENRHVGSMRPKLKAGDLVWLEPKDGEAESIRSQADIESIQWARWGRRGKPLAELLPAHVLPDYLAEDGMVDEVTDLFGQVSPKKDCPAPAFAARIRPENLVFFDAAGRVERVMLPALSSPKPGCLAFYRENASVDKLSARDPVRGYKVYRTTTERDADAPWTYNQQPVFAKAHPPEPETNRQNKTSSLLPEGVKGRLRIAFRALSRRELALLLLACEVDWRLGGGKPFGLGHCRIRIVRLLDEFGQPLEHGVDVAAETRDLAERVELWRKAVGPAAGPLRYPRAVNVKTDQRGGHVWFMRHAAPRKATKDAMSSSGLMPIHVKIGSPLHGNLKDSDFDPHEPMIAGQTLPPLAAADQRLYGYDAVLLPLDAAPGPNGRTLYEDIEKYDHTKHKMDGKNQENLSINRDDRRRQKRDRE
ncbi:MAG: hypothetical protein LBE84_02240 [Planctomycetota bacterium]|jgi:CRISPR-associated protein (TIGR03986 family)|nr:hypothetical protein [Planctomycetota bacterium]